MNRRVSQKFWLGLALCAFAAAARPNVVSADTPAAGKIEKITTVEGITEYRLGNGMKVLLYPDPSKSTVTTNVTYFVGSRHEGYGETGMAHLLEHMVFKGTPNHPAIWKALQDHGANFNGTTSYDRTNYFETLAANDENLEFALNMESDRMVNSKIANSDLQSEFTVVRNEFEQGENSPMNVLQERIMSTAYLWHNYGKSTIGSREDIERVPIERLQAFYRKFYQPDNAMLVVAGKFDVEKTLGLINKTFGAIPRPTRELEKTYTVEPTQDGEREVLLRRVGDVQAVGCVYHICAGSHEDMPALEILSDVMTADQTGRLYKALVEPQLAVDVSGEAMNMHDPGLVQFFAEVRLDKSIDEVRKILVDTVEGFAKTEITEEEVERAKNLFARRFEQLMSETGRVGVTISEWAAQGDWRLMFLYRDRIAKVTPADVQRVAAHYLTASNRTIGTFIPTKEPVRSTIPPTPDVLALVKDYKGAEAMAVGEAYEPKPEVVESRTTRGELPIGIKTAMLPKKTKGKQVNLSLTLHYGTEADLKGMQDAADMMGDMLDSGTSKHTKRQIKDEFDKLKANVGIGGGLGTVSVNIKAPRKNLPAVLELVAECLKDSNFPEKEFDKIKKQAISGLEQQLSEPRALAMIEMRRRIAKYGPDDVRYVPTVQESIDRTKAIKLDDVKKLHKEWLGTGNAELAVVGDFDTSELNTLIDNLFKGWKSAKPYERIAMKYQKAAPETLAIPTPDKQMAIFAMGQNVELRDDDADYAALFMGNYILGGNANSRLMNRIRQKEGLSYGCGSGLQVSSQDKNGSFFAFGICAPENAEKATQCALEEIRKICSEGVTQKELDEARKGYFEQFKQQLSNEGAVAGMLARQTYLGRTMKFTQEQMAKIEKLTAEDVNKALKKYFDAGQLVVVKAGDFNKKKTEPTTTEKPKKEPAADAGSEKPATKG